MFIHFFCLCPLGNTIDWAEFWNVASDPLTVKDKSREHIIDSFGACTARDASDKAEKHVEDYNTLRNWVTPP